MDSSVKDVQELDSRWQILFLKHNDYPHPFNAAITSNTPGPFFFFPPNDPKKRKISKN